MPYITPKRRKELQHTIDNLLLHKLTIGDANYVITLLLQNYINTTGERYSTYNEAIGVLECAKLELYRKFVSSYEDKKITENGDVNIIN